MASDNIPRSTSSSPNWLDAVPDHVLKPKSTFASQIRRAFLTSGLLVYSSTAISMVLALLIAGDGRLPIASLVVLVFLVTGTACGFRLLAPAPLQQDPLGLVFDETNKKHNSSRNSKVAKTALDTFAALALLVLMLPLIITIAFLIRLDGGPVFFYSTRVGRFGRPFVSVKFRVMVTDRYLDERLREEKLWVVDKANVRQKGVDYRFTRIGRFLRMASLDELPQLINVLKGDMSLVGPQPLPPSQRVLNSEAVKDYLSVRPGLTGSSKLGKFGEDSVSEILNSDLLYVRDWSFWKDIRLLAQAVFRTFSEILSH